MIGRRSGWTLTETLVVMSLISLTLGIASTLLAATFRQQRTITDRQDFDRSIARLEQRLRADAHAAQSAKAEGSEEGTAALRLRFADGETIVYEAQDGVVERRVEEQGELKHRDSFRLSQCAIQVEAIQVDVARGLPAVKMVVSPAGDSASPSLARTRTIFAVVGIQPGDAHPEGESP